MYLLTLFVLMSVFLREIATLNYRVITSRKKLHHQVACDVYVAKTSSMIDCGQECDDIAGCIHFAKSDGQCYSCINRSHTFGNQHFIKSSSQSIPDLLGSNAVIYEKTDIVNECLSNPCIHGTCEDREEEFYCNCDAGYSGATCNRLVNCGTPSNPSFGSVVTDKNMEGGIASYSCNYGYILNGASQRTCQSSEDWSGAAPTCQLVNCGTPSNPTYGSVVTDNNTEGGIASYSCNSGYNINGASQRICQSSEEWSVAAPTCQLVNCGTPSNPTYGSVVTDNNTEGGIASYSCNSGYNINGASQRICQSSEEWSVAAPTCQPVDCGALNKPTYGSVVTNKNTYGGIATYSCNTGYILKGGRKRTCQVSGTWSSSAPTCTVVSCGSLSSPTNGTVISDKNTFQGRANYTCESRFSLDGNSERTCTSTGWDGSVPKCIALPPSSCADLYEDGVRSSGVYTINVTTQNVSVFCDMDTAGGGWTVFQRRKDGSVSFAKTWVEYQNGFGDMNGEFWLGNDRLALITASQTRHTLRIDLESFDKETRYAEYADFKIGNKADDYRLHCGKYSGTAGDGLEHLIGHKFSTKDRDNDVFSYNICAVVQGGSGGWWYKSCGSSILNAVYGNSTTSGVNFIRWKPWLDKQALKHTEMKLKPVTHD